MINFSKTEQSVRELKSQVNAGEIDQETFEAHLIEMIDFAPDGHYWMFGHETESWYQYDGQQWIPKDPGKLRMFEPKGEDVPQVGTGPHNPEPLNSVEPVNHLPPPSEQSLASDWRTINWAWFVAGLIAIGLVGWIVYTSSLL